MMASRSVQRWLAALLVAALAPGVVQFRGGRLRFALLLGVVWVAVLGTVGWAAMGGGSWVGVLVDPVRLRAALVAVSAGMVVVPVSVLSAHQCCRPAGAGALVSVAGGVCSVATAVPFMVVLWWGWPQVGVAEHSFVAAPVAVPSVLTDPSYVEGVRGVTAAATAATAAAGGGGVGGAPVATMAGADRLNVLLLGGDAGPGRWGLRTDSINLVSVDVASGDVVLVGVPRNLVGVPVPPGLAARFPTGFPGLMNALYGWGVAHQDEVVAAVGPTEDPGASLVAASVAELTGVRVDAFVLVDMAGFIDVVDAFGGVEVYVPKSVPAPGNVPAGKHPVPDRFEVGWRWMDGTDALAYARSRHADSDYWRMARQRCVVAALVTQTSTGDLVRSWPALASVIAGRVRTNLSAEQLVVLRDSVDRAALQYLALTPPLVASSGWDPVAVRALVAATLDPPPSPTATLDPPPSPTATPTDPPTPSSVTSGAGDVSDVCVLQP